jgi:hypothetical protein
VWFVEESSIRRTVLAAVTSTLITMNSSGAIAVESSACIIRLSLFIVARSGSKGATKSKFNVRWKLVSDAARAFRRCMAAYHRRTPSIVTWYLSAAAPIVPAGK